MSIRRARLVAWPWLLAGLAAVVLAGAACTQPRLDACGHDISGAQSRLVAVDAASGQVRWSTNVPLDAAYLMPVGGDRARVPAREPLELDDTVVNVATGAIVGTVADSNDRLVIDASGETGPIGTQSINGEVRPDVVEFGGLKIAADRVSTPDDLHLIATSAQDGAVKWTTTLHEGNDWGGVTRPLLVDSTVLISIADRTPTCY
ncbi:MAG: hypothetical protein MUE36_12255 [Acidimicrobiales bacterium]|jgi:outer membrane protein assembly factor BamB|nr:hypothetical protein [Acidimicrobiales bacterium]